MPITPDKIVVSWEEWIAGLNKEIKHCGLERCYGVIEAATAWDGWSGYFNDGLLPIEAIEEDLSNL